MVGFKPKTKRERADPIVKVLIREYAHIVGYHGDKIILPITTIKVC